MNVKRILLGIILIMILAAILFLLYTYYRPHRNIAGEKLTGITASGLLSAYQDNEPAANSKFLDKAILVSGRISEIKINQEKQSVIILSTKDPVYGVVCTMKDNITNVAVNDSVAIKGFCSGYTSDVVLRDCILVR